MITSSSVKGQAFRLRLEGQSYNEINRKLGVPKATLSGWFSALVLSAKAQKRIRDRVAQGTLNGLVKRNIMQTHLAQKRANFIRKTAQNEISDLTKEELRLLGVALYWGEGYKRPIVRGGKERTGHSISFVNSDPEMIRVFIRFLKEILGIIDTEFRIAMRLYPHINEKIALKYWMNVTLLNKSSFRKTTYLVSSASKRKRPFNRLPYGTLQIGVYNTEKFHRIMGWIEGVKNQF